MRTRVIGGPDGPSSRAGEGSGATRAGSSGPVGRLTPTLLVESLGRRAGPAVWGYRDAVVAAAADLDLAVRHDLGLVQIGLVLASAPELLVGWRVDHGWYFVRRHGPGEPPATGPTRYRPATDPLDQLVPEPAAVARWLRALSRGHWLGVEPTPVAVSPAGVRAVLDRLQSYPRSLEGPIDSVVWDTALGA